MLSLVENELFLTSGPVCCRWALTDADPKGQHRIVTVELKWLENLSDHENMFETGVFRYNEC